MVDIFKFWKSFGFGEKNYLNNSQQDFKYLLVPSDLQFHSWPCAAWEPELVDLKVHQECKEKKANKRNHRGLEGGATNNILAYLVFPFECQHSDAAM